MNKPVKLQNKPANIVPCLDCKHNMGSMCYWRGTFAYADCTHYDNGITQEGINELRNVVKTYYNNDVNKYLDSFINTPYFKEFIGKKIDGK